MFNTFRKLVGNLFGSLHVSGFRESRGITVERKPGSSEISDLIPNPHIEYFITLTAKDGTSEDVQVSERFYLKAVQ